ncbi:hypothetical protein RRF57_008752 [Xylaria bambusicola]|uniref:Uncharacterized protein n=1 Tax=Xylaria bambusicola TaxID=326684 RepID=A0AAN7ZBL6_9PEZI
MPITKSAGVRNWSTASSLHTDMVFATFLRPTRPRPIVPKSRIRIPTSRTLMLYAEDFCRRQSKQTHLYRTAVAAVVISQQTTNEKDFVAAIPGCAGVAQTISFALRRSFNAPCPSTCELFAPFLPARLSLHAEWDTAFMNSAVAALRLCHGAARAAFVAETVPRA